MGVSPRQRGCKRGIPRPARRSRGAERGRAWLFAAQAAFFAASAARSAAERVFPRVSGVFPRVSGGVSAAFRALRGVLAARSAARRGFLPRKRRGVAALRRVSGLGVAFPRVSGVFPRVSGGVSAAFRALRGVLAARRGFLPRKRRGVAALRRVSGLGVAFPRVSGALNGGLSAFSRRVSGDERGGSSPRQRQRASDGAAWRLSAASAASARRSHGAARRLSAASAASARHSHGAARRSRGAARRSLDERGVLTARRGKRDDRFGVFAAWEGQKIGAWIFPSPSCEIFPTFLISI